jgi:intracellular multiplication protein IcmT
MWRDTGLSPQFFVVDARILFPLFVFFMHISKITFYIALSGILVFWIMGRFGWTPQVLFRSILRFLARPYHPRIDKTVFYRRSRW